MNWKTDIIPNFSMTWCHKEELGSFYLKGGKGK